MNRYWWVFSMAVFFLIACHSKQGKDIHNHMGHSGAELPLTQADSLYKEVMDAHDAVMPKMGKLRGSQKRAQQLLDSISLLPVKKQVTCESLKVELEKLVNELNYADFAMDTWMTEFNLDSGNNDLKVRIKYLTDERMKVIKVKEAVLHSLNKADSLLKK